MESFCSIDVVEIMDLVLGLFKISKMEEDMDKIVSCVQVTDMIILLILMLMVTVMTILLILMLIVTVMTILLVLIEIQSQDIRSSIDGDGDGEISRDEFVNNAMKSKFLTNMLRTK